jgi:hypothetical protein
MRQQFGRFEEDLRAKRDRLKRSKGRISNVDQERHVTLDLRFWARNTSEERSVKSCKTPEDRSPNESQSLAMGETKTIDLPMRVRDSVFGQKGC